MSAAKQEALMKANDDAGNPEARLLSTPAMSSALRAPNEQALIHSVGELSDEVLEEYLDGQLKWAPIQKRASLTFLATYAVAYFFVSDAVGPVGLMTLPGHYLFYRVSKNKVKSGQIDVILLRELEAQAKLIKSRLGLRERFGKALKRIFNNQYERELLRERTFQARDELVKKLPERKDFA
ncbi:MAG: hypothetical protein GY822_30620 [Deltaproteobacteria bacterium]|nr:hypothetical protein [Deltaproteobacteria bacterium]